MNIGGFQKMTLLDFPGKVACTVFTVGCNFRCPFCHNASLVTCKSNELYSENDVLSFLEKRRGLLDGVCITGGEPLMQKDISGFIAKIRQMGYAVKLDTNGSFPDRLKQLVNDGMIDYVAMDVKNCLDRYSETAGVEMPDLSIIEESIDFLLEGNVDCEFRTTVVKEFHCTDDIDKLAQRIKGAKRYYLQNFVDSGELIGENLHSVDRKTMEQMKEIAEKYIENVSLRGI